MRIFCYFHDTEICNFVYYFMLYFTAELLYKACSKKISLMLAVAYCLSTMCYIGVIWKIK